MKTTILAELDFVVASPHVALKQDTAKATDRILRAIENRYVNVIGHPTGRLIFGREGLPLNFARIFKAAADTGTALEINAAFPRLDLNDVAAHGAIAAGVKLSINTDAHNTQDFDQMKFGIFVAQRLGHGRGCHQLHDAVQAEGIHPPQARLILFETPRGLPTSVGRSSSQSLPPKIKKRKRTEGEPPPSVRI